MVSNENKISTGRGGAGNIGSPKMTPQRGTKDLETPDIKTSIYTTGRGGAGNMARFEKDDPTEARIAQDVAPVTRHDNPGAPVKIGRGGAANIIKGEDSQSDSRGKRSNSGSDRGSNASVKSNGSRRRRSSSIVDKGREMLHRVRDASAARKGSS